MVLHTRPVLTDALKRDVAILSTLAQLHYAVLPQLHALCFPLHTLATARLTLHALAEATLVSPSPWQINGGCCARGRVWTLTVKGYDLLQRYASHVPPLARLELARPSTRLEQEEWRVRLAVRTVLVRLLLEARGQPVLHRAAVSVPSQACWPTACGGGSHPAPDAVVSIVWHPAVQQPADWLPWLLPSPGPSEAIHYPIYLERAHTPTSLASILPLWVEICPAPSYIPVMILHDETRFAPPDQHHPPESPVPALRLAPWSALAASIVEASWRNACGLRCSLRPSSEQTVA
jgi:hypothetical protein